MPSTKQLDGIFHFKVTRNFRVGLQLVGIIFLRIINTRLAEPLILRYNTRTLNHSTVTDPPAPQEYSHRASPQATARATTGGIADGDLNFTT